MEMDELCYLREGKNDKKREKTVYEGIKKLHGIPRENYQNSLREVEKEDLITETMWLRDALLTYDNFHLERYNAWCENIKHLKEDNERLRKAVHNIYEDFKRKALKFIVSGVSTGEQLQTFKDIFTTYLK